MSTTLALAIAFSAAIATAQQPQQPPPPKEQQQQEPKESKAAGKTTERSGGGTTIPGDTANVFVETAARANVAEVELGNLAEQKATSDQVKQFARRLVADHTKANDELKTIAASKQITVPTKPDPKHNALKSRLESLKGSAFDGAYIGAMLNDHRTAIAAFQSEAKNGADPQLKAYAAKALPTLEEHLKLAQAAEAALHKSGQ